MVARPSQALHGSLARYKKHIRDGEEACPECKQANAKDNQKYRNRTPETRARVRQQNKASSRANTALRHLFPVEWEVLYQRHLKQIEEEDRGEG